eukprot:411039_1
MDNIDWKKRVTQALQNKFLVKLTRKELIDSNILYKEKLSHKLQFNAHKLEYLFQRKKVYYMLKKILPIDDDNQEYFVSDDPNRVIVIDNGTSQIKAGFSGQHFPVNTFPTLIGRPRHMGVMVGFGGRNYFCGQRAQTMRGILSLKDPIRFGQIHNWDDMEKLWKHTFDEELHVCSNEHPVLLTEPILNSRRNKEKMIEIMFETFNCPSYYAITQQLLSLYASGSTTGIVLHSGCARTQSIAIFDGYMISNSAQHINMGGRDVSDFLTKILCERGCSFTTTAERMIVGVIKERLGWVTLDYEQEVKNAETSMYELEKRYELPDGQVITYGSELFRAAEILFSPQLIGQLQKSGIHELILRSIMGCSVDMNVRKKLFANVVLCGGNVQFKGIQQRLQKELRMFYNFGCRGDFLIDGYFRESFNDYLHPKKLGIDVVNLIYRNLDVFKSILTRNDDLVKVKKLRKYGEWIGGSILSSLPLFDKLSIKKYEYDEIGSGVVHRNSKNDMSM